MVKVYRSTVLNAPADRVWRDLRDFNGLANWHPFIVSSRIEQGHPADKVGCVRYLQLKDGGRIREKLLSLSDYDFTCTSAILESPMDLTGHVATLRLFPVTEGNRCFIEWSAEFDCPPGKDAEVAETIGGGVFQTGLEALKKRYGQR
jgi:Polyketide cyclase / dehydrase and lipid transport